LNELDGFAVNTGVVVLATTNHPEKLDSAILERPSRFDRKYYFNLPADGERLEFVASWNTSLEDDLRLSDSVLPRIVDATDGFSFAYLKELFVSSMMQWVGERRRGRMDSLMLDRAVVLREQMNESLSKKQKKREKKKAGKAAASRL